MGKSSKPTARYSTSEMARDTLDLLDALGWTAQRELNVVGTSMGGMIAQELAVLAPGKPRPRLACLSKTSLGAEEGLKPQTPPSVSYPNPTHTNSPLYPKQVALPP